MENISIIAIFTIIGVMLGRIKSLFSMVSLIFLQTVRLEDIQYKHLHKFVKFHAIKWVFEDKISQRKDESETAPSIFSGCFWIKGFSLFFISSEERELKAGYQGVDTVSVLYILRWKRNSFMKFFNDIDCSSKTIDILLHQGEGAKYLGSIMKKSDAKISSIAQELEYDIKQITSGNKTKTSAIFYGKPGNGKTTLVRNLAQKYGLDIHLVNFSKGINNEDILTISVYTNKPVIILFEDFDNIFHGRKLQLPDTSAKCSFDSILNLLDGIFNESSNIYIFTANDLSKIDDALLDRPSRIRHKIEVKNPSFDDIFEIIKDKELAENLIGKNLDTVYEFKHKLSQNRSA